MLFASRYEPQAGWLQDEVLHCPWAFWSTYNINAVSQAINSAGTTFVFWTYNDNGELQGDLKLLSSKFEMLKGEPPIADAGLDQTVTEGEVVRVQVARDAFGEKGAQLSLNLTLPGRLLVFGPLTDRQSVSRQIEDEEERERLLGIVDDIAVEQEGFIVRTVAEGASAVQIEQLAGDLLPESNLQQKVASGYNRLLQTTEEGGALVVGDRGHAVVRVAAGGPRQRSAGRDRCARRERTR